MQDNPGAEFNIIGREIALKWKNAHSNLKKIYEDKASRDMDRYKREIG